MTINDGMKKFRLPNPTCEEDLENRGFKILRFGDKVLLTGHYYNGPHKPCYFAAIYEFLDEDRDAESIIGLSAVEDAEFQDEGHAIEWAIKH